MVLKNNGTYDDACDILLKPMQGIDLTGLWASGNIFTGVANSIGQHHWFETETFSLDYSLINPSNKMVKACYAGTKWDQSDYENYIFHYLVFSAQLQKIE